VVNFDEEDMVRRVVVEVRTVKKREVKASLMRNRRPSRILLNPFWPTNHRHPRSPQPTSSPLDPLGLRIPDAVFVTFLLVMINVFPIDSPFMTNLFIPDYFSMGRLRVHDYFLSQAHSHSLLLFVYSYSPMYADLP